MKVEDLMYKFAVGDRVYKNKGYRFVGTVVSNFHTLADEKRIVVELDECATSGGMLHIFNEGQFDILEEEVSCVKCNCKEGE